MQHATANDRLPPNDKQAEMSVLGSILRDNRSFDDVAQILKPSDFYQGFGQMIFQAMIDIHGLGHKPIDVVTLWDRLKEKNQHEEVKAPFLHELWDSAPSAANAVHYAEIVWEKSLARQVLNSCMDLTRAVHSNMPGSEVLELAEKTIFRIAQNREATNTYTLAQVVNDSIDHIEMRSRMTDLLGIPSGWPDLDYLTGGFRSSELVIVGARPSIGKTAFGLNLFYQTVITNKLPAIFFTLEQTKTEIGERFYCLHGKVDSRRIRSSHEISGTEWENLAQAREELAQGVAYINDGHRMTILQIFSEARRWKMKANIRMVIVDYLQLVQSEVKGERHEQVGDISRKLKIMARELQIPVIAMAQLNRNSDDRKPRLSDLRESGSIEQDADTVILLHEGTKEGQPRKPELEVIVAKQRNGPTGELMLFFDRKFMKLNNMCHDIGGVI